MTTKTLTGIYSSGYTLSAAYSGLVLANTAVVTGFGLSTTSAVSITNNGAIVSQHGAYNKFGDGGVGNVGLTADGATTLVNNFEILGGGGGNGGVSTGGHAGGAASTGVLLAAVGTITNNFIIDGGAGGNAGGGGAGAGGGAGGVGIDLIVGGRLTNGGGGSISGGNGGYGADGLLGTGNGGAGGAGVLATAALTLSNTGSIAGGYGGYGAVNIEVNGHGGTGGAGGSGVLVIGGGSLSNAGQISGGGGGHGGIFGVAGGAGGAGGDGVFLASGGVLSNAGMIFGGFGGSGGYSPSANGPAGAAGDGVFLQNSGTVTNGGATNSMALISGRIGVFGGGPNATVINFGTIEGYINGSGVAVQLTTANDRLIVEVGATFTGAVQGGGGTLELAAGTGTISGLGSSFSGFGSYVIDAGGSWTLTGSNDVFAGQSVTNNGVFTVTGELALAGSISGGPGAYALPAQASGTGVTGVTIGAGGGLGTTATARITGGQGGHGFYAGREADYYAGAGGLGGDGVDLLAGGELTNPGGGLISGGQGGTGGGDEHSGSGGTGGVGVRLSGAALIANYGRLQGGVGGTGGYLDHFYVGGPGGAGGVGAYLSGGGSLINTGAVLGGAGGEGGSAGAANGQQGAGLVLGAGGSVRNAVHGTIAGAVGVYDAPGGYGTINTFGRIAGYGGVAVQFASAGDRLIAEAGSAFIGKVEGGGGTLELAGGTGVIGGLGGVGMLSGAVAMGFSGFGSYVIDKGASWTLVGADVLSSGKALTAAGTVTNSGAFTVAGTVGGAGTLALAGGAATFGPGAALTVSRWSLSGTAKATLGEDLAYAGTVTTAAGTTLALGTHTLTLTGTGSSLAGAVTGSGTLAITSGTDTLAGTSLKVAHVAISGGVVTLAGSITEPWKMNVGGTGSLTVAKAGASLAGAGVITLAGTAIGAVSFASVLTNGVTLEGLGNIGEDKLALTNSAAGVIKALGAGLLTLDTASHAVVNAGTIEAWTGSTLTMKSGVANTGVLATHFGTVTLQKAVTGAGVGQINGGTLEALSSFTEDVTFTGTTGVLELAYSRLYTGKITGLSTTGKSSLDLLDIKFISTAQTTATFVDNGSMTGGVLTVTDGTHIAKISLVGDYAGHVFKTSDDGHGGTTVVDPAAHPAPTRHAFVEAAAAFGAGAGGAAPVGSASWTRQPLVLASPRGALQA